MLENRRSARLLRERLQNAVFSIKQFVISIYPQIKNQHWTLFHVVERRVDDDEIHLHDLFIFKKCAKQNKK